MKKIVVILSMILFCSPLAIAEDPLAVMQAAYAKKDFAKAASYGEMIFRENPDNVAIGMLLAESYSGLKKYRKAMDTYKELLKREPDNMDVVYGLGGVYAKLEYYRNAGEAFRQVVEKEPDNAQANYQLGLMHALCMDLSEEYSQYRILKKLEPKLAEQLLPYIQSNK
jgi:tetratricopeptide (TPR) repeat protein